MAQTAGNISDFFAQTYGYREYLRQSVIRDLKTKYKRSVLGYLWTMLHPLGMMVVLAVVFSNIMRIPVEDYAVFLFAGMLPFNYFNASAMMSLPSVKANARLFSQVPVPKYIFILSQTFSNLVNYLLAIIPLLAIMLVVGRPITPAVLAFPVLLLPLFFVTVGVSLILAVSNVFFDDTLHITEVALLALYFLSPILYHRDLLPPSIVKYLVLNPLFCQIEAIRGIFYDGTLPDWNVYAINFAASALILIFGLWLFKKAEDKFLYFI